MKHIFSVHLEGREPSHAKQLLRSPALCILYLNVKSKTTNVNQISYFLSCICAENLCICCDTNIVTKPFKIWQIWTEISAGPLG